MPSLILKSREDFSVAEGRILVKWRISVSMLALFLFFPDVPGYSQLPTSSLRVDVENANKGSPVEGLHVQLLQGVSGTTFEVGITNSSGSVDFQGLTPGDYKIEVSGQGIETTDSAIFHIDSTLIFSSQQVVVHSIATYIAGAGNAVNVHELNVPPDASQELARGDQAMQQKNWKQAVGHYNKALAIYPKYALAYYNLSTAYLQMQQPDKQRDALQKALDIDDHFVPALVGLAHLEFADHKYPETLALLDTAIAADPADVEALALRVRVDYMQANYQAAISDAQKVHSLPHEGYATVHYTAAAAYQQLNRIPEMIEELKMYLKEDPTSPNAAYVRQTIISLGGKPN